MLGIRFGYRLSQLDHADGLSFGIGLSPGNLEIGYAFLPQGPLGLSHEIGIGYRFKPAPPRAITEALRAKEQLTSQAFYEQGCRYQLDAQYDDAAQAFELALIWDPENQTAQDKLSEVNELHRKELIQTRLERGRELYEASKLFDALRELKEAAALDSLNPEVRNLLDRIRKELDLEAAQQSQAVKSQLDAGLAHYSRGNYRLALKSYQDVLKIEPGNPTAQRYLLEIQTELDSLSQESLKRAEHYIDRGQWARAITELNQGLRLDPESPALKLKLSEVSARVSKEKSQCLSEGIEKFQAKKYAEAVQKFHEVLRLAPGDPTAQEYLKRINRSSVSQDPYTLYLAGIKAYTDEDYELAISYWEQVLRLDPKFERARENLKRARSKLALLEGS
jgi:tetratricopeptide (TPR) repeat protein